MPSTSVRSILLLLTLWAGLHVGSFSEAFGQAVEPEVREAYFRALGDHFRVPLQEVSLLAEWNLSSDEVPVVLFLARQAGISPDALVGVRQSGQGWMDVATRFGVGARAFHFPLREESELGPLTRAFRLFRETAPGQWHRIRLEDGEIVALVNVRVLSEEARVSPIRVLQCREEYGSFVACFPRLRGP